VCLSRSRIIKQSNTRMSTLEECLMACCRLTIVLFLVWLMFLRVQFLLKTDSGYPRDAEVTLFTLANPEHSLRFNAHWSAPPVSALARSRGTRKISCANFHPFINCSLFPSFSSGFIFLWVQFDYRFNFRC